MPKDDHKHEDTHHESNSYTVTDVIVTLALARSLVRDVKEYASELVENSPNLREKIHPVAHKVSNFSSKQANTYLPKLTQVMRSPSIRFAGFALTLIALGIHGQHLAHQFKHTQRKINHQVDDISSGIMRKYGHFGDVEIRKMVYPRFISWKRNEQA